jgi:glycosyltransferase involved in cell wall biosynthesis
LKKKLSIIITNYNNGKYISKCIKSIINQKKYFSKINLIIIDDCSKDNSLEIIKKYLKFKNIKLIKNKKNLGLVKSCNKAIKSSKTEFIIRVDSDDYVSKNFIKYFIKYTNKNYHFIFSDYKIMTKNTFKNIKIKKFQELISCSVAFKKNIFSKIGGYRNFLWEEYDFYLRYLDKTKKIKKINEYLYYYRRHNNNMTKLKSWQKKAWKELKKFHNNKVIENFNKKLKLE